MRFQGFLSFVPLISFASPVLSAVIKSRSVVEGAVFDRIVYIWLENTNFDDAQSDPNLSALAAKGLTLSTYYAVTHPSQPNYVGSVGGEYFGMDSDDTFDIPATVATVVDLLEDKDISWAEYEEGMPFSGFNGSTTNPITGANDYMRKHNPLISYESISGNPDRLANIKNFTLLEQDLAAGPLPQWIFITPNMTNDGHDTDVTFAGNWVNTFLPPLLENPNFNDDRTLVVLTFDEVGSTLHNNVFAIVLGGALPSNLIGTTDSNFYTHYSFLATVEANWNLHTLGRWDLGANVLDFVAAVTGDTVRKTSTLLVFLAASYPGAFNSLITANIPVPNTNYVVNGRTVLPAIVEQWGSQVACTAYDGQLVPPAGLSPPSIPAGC